MPGRRQPARAFTEDKIVTDAESSIPLIPQTEPAFHIAGGQEVRRRHRPFGTVLYCKTFRGGAEAVRPDRRYVLVRPEKSI